MITLSVFLPLIGAIIAGLFGRVIGARGAQVVTCGALIVSAVFGTVIFAQAVGGQEPYTVELFTWMTSGSLDFSWSLRVD